MHCTALSINKLVSGGCPAGVCYLITPKIPQSSPKGLADLEVSSVDGCWRVGGLGFRKVP